MSHKTLFHSSHNCSTFSCVFFTPWCSLFHFFNQKGEIIPLFHLFPIISPFLSLRFALKIFKIQVGFKWASNSRISKQTVVPDQLYQTLTKWFKKRQNYLFSVQNSISNLFITKRTCYSVLAVAGESAPASWDCCWHFANSQTGQLF